jgi:hypothetical protein
MWGDEFSTYFLQYLIFKGMDFLLVQIGNFLVLPTQRSTTTMNAKLTAVHFVTGARYTHRQQRAVPILTHPPLVRSRARSFCCD